MVLLVIQYDSAATEDTLCAADLAADLVGILGTNPEAENPVVGINHVILAHSYQLLLDTSHRLVRGNRLVGWLVSASEYLCAGLRRAGSK